MRTELILFQQGAAPSLAAAGSIPGPQPDGTVVCAIDNCPERMVVARLLERLTGLFPAEGVTRVEFADLPAPRTGACCGGACGG